MNDDCLNYFTNITDKSIDLILVDPPYGITKNEKDKIIPIHPMCEQIIRIVKDNGAIIMFGSGKFTATMIKSMENIYRYSLIWQKTTPTGFLNANKMPLRTHEDIMVFYKIPPTYNPQKTTGHKRKVSRKQHKANCKETKNYGNHNLSSYDSTERFPTSVLHFPTDKQKQSFHPTQKPIALLEWLIKTYSNENDTILDFAAGSMSTAIACINTNRNCIVIEKDEEYFSIGEKRVQQHSKQYRNEVNR